MSARDELKEMVNNCAVGVDDEQPIAALAERLLDAIEQAHRELERTHKWQASWERIMRARAILERALKGEK